MKRNYFPPEASLVGTIVQKGCQQRFFFFVDVLIFFLFFPLFLDFRFCFGLDKISDEVAFKGCLTGIQYQASSIQYQHPVVNFP